MIISEKRSLQRILTSVEGYENIFIIGCGDCATTCCTGGEPEVENLRQQLEKWGKKVVGAIVFNTPCHVQKTRRELQQAKPELDQADAVIVLACGAGVQSVSELMKKKVVVPGLNSLFLGNIKRQGWFDERCSMCGDCVLDKTFGICPITRCAKSLPNGPCGGSRNGKCEVNGDRDCAWALIFERGELLGKTGELDEYQPMKDFEITIKPGSVDIRKESQDERSIRVEHYRDQKLAIQKKFHALAKSREHSPEPGQTGAPVSKLQEALESGKNAATCEIIPPKGVNTAEVLEHGEFLRDCITAFSINENPGSVMRTSSLSISALYAAKGLEPIMHLTTRERNRLALQSDLMGAWVLGVRNALIMTGDHQSVGDHKEAKPVYDLDSVQLIKLVSELRKGKDYNGNPLDGSPDFFTGAVVNPASDMPRMQILKMKKKIQAGAKYFITQGIFDPDFLAGFLDEIASEGINTFIIAGIILLKSEKMARFMQKNIPGIIIPEKLIERIEKYSDKRSACTEITRELVEACRKLVPGIHLMPIGWYDLVPEILK
ncbi:MAG: methylenetetrahydrofolate reductase C-terminal domain-containing protein [Firmicutes bacterium]|nr:methylenetetrahydrofolate reductase C-terminal domain-containing protein [Bacillota bacterium]